MKLNTCKLTTIIMSQLIDAFTATTPIDIQKIMIIVIVVH